MKTKEELMVAFDLPSGKIDVVVFYVISLGITLVTIFLAKVFGKKQ